jgi:transcriptional regulator with XRE-family HTH domain
LDELTPTETFARRLREARENAKLSQEDLRRRLDEDIGFKKLTKSGFKKLSRSAIAQIELGKRDVSLDEVLAIAAALGVAPIHLIVTFEDERVISEESAELGIFEPTAALKIGDRLSLIPVEARKWIRGTSIYPDAPLDLWRRYYVTEVPPAVRYRLRQVAAFARDHKEKLGRWKLPRLEIPSEERATEMAVPGFTTPENHQGFPTPLWTWLMYEREEED